MARKPTSGLRFQPAGGERRTQVPVGKKQTLRIERLSGDGRGIAFLGGRTWFVSGALAEEQVEARVLNARGKVVEARLERVFTASAQRREPPCKHYARCGGCNLQHLPEADQLSLKQGLLADQLQRVAGLQPQHWAAPLSGPAFAYRRRARLAVRWDPKAKHLEVGYRAEASQAIVEVDECPVLVQPLQSLLRHVPTVLRSLSKPQALGHVELFDGTATALLLRHLGALPDQDVARLQAFCDEAGAQLWLQGEGEPQPTRVDKALGFALAPWGLELAWRPGDFVQVNAAVNTAMIAQALEWLAPQPGERVLDLFCGLGNFALPLARQTGAVVAVEGVQAMVERAAANARGNEVENVEFFQADLAQPLGSAEWAAEGFSAVLLDPPRDGALAVVRDIARLKARRVVYVSCNPATLARDAQVLAEQGYRLTRAGVLDMFPQTAHVEAMALFEVG